MRSLGGIYLTTTDPTHRPREKRVRADHGTEGQGRFGRMPTLEV